MPSLTQGSSEHRRCSSCRSLLPPQFWRSGPAQPLAITLTGAVGHGKTTWLMSLLAPPRLSRYAIIGLNEHHTVQPYDFVEPYTISMLEWEFRSPMPFLLMGCTIHHPEGLVDVRTLDIKGEMFTTNTEDVSKRIELHLLGRRGGGGLLVVEKFSKEADRASTNIASTYLRLSTGIKDKLHGRSTLWKGIIWTFLDSAVWSGAAEAWLERSVSPSDALIAIGRGTADAMGPLTPHYEEIRRSNDGVLIALLKAVRSDEEMQPDEIEGVIALLFRLQLLYSSYVARKRVDRLDYFYRRGGQRYVTICQELAKQLYMHWDADLGGLGPILTGGDEDDDWQVLPCGRLVSQQTSESVWSDQIVIEAIARASRLR
ncbi:MAG TPA: hypothetical protein VGQ46_20200 [Thermoanaerobaculia bacterium]|nr:hypothetical protein [Thermoanaerobaculia bacterium]